MADSILEPIHGLDLHPIGPALVRQHLQWFSCCDDFTHLDFLAPFEPFFPPLLPLFSRPCYRSYSSDRRVALATLATTATLSLLRYKK